MWRSSSHKLWVFTCCSRRPGVFVEGLFSHALMYVSVLLFCSHGVAGASLAMIGLSPRERRRRRSLFQVYRLQRCRPSILDGTLALPNPLCPVPFPFPCKTKVKEVQESLTPAGKSYRWQAAALLALQVPITLTLKSLTLRSAPRCKHSLLPAGSSLRTPGLRDSLPTPHPSL